MTRIEMWQSRLPTPTVKETVAEKRVCHCLRRADGPGGQKCRQKHLYVPEPYNDFIFSITCEELGFIGALLVIFLFVWPFCCAAGPSVAVNARDKFGSMLVVGVIVQITLQAALNIAVVTNTIPNTGISLPFFSSGGTSLVMLLCEMGSSAERVAAKRGETAVISAPKRPKGRFGFCVLLKPGHMRPGCLFEGGTIYEGIDCGRRHSRAHQPRTGHCRRDKGAVPAGRGALCRAQKRHGIWPCHQGRLPVPPH